MVFYVNESNSVESLRYFPLNKFQFSLLHIFYAFIMYFITAECDPATLTLANGSITLDRYYGGDDLLYSCDDGYTKTTDPVCTESGNWSHDPSCVVSNEEPGIVTTEPRGNCNGQEVELVV